MSDNHPSSAPANAASNTQVDGYLRVDPVTGNLQFPQPAKSDKPQIQKPTAPNPAPPELIPDERDA